LLADLAGPVVLSLRPRRSVEAESLFLRRELALYRERGVKPRRVVAATRVSLALLSRLFDWRDALVVVRPETLNRWHQAGWPLFWGVKSRPGPGRMLDNNRAENSPLVIRRRERKQQRLKSQRSAQTFLATHTALFNNIKVQRHLIRRPTRRLFRAEADRAWAAATAAAWAIALSRLTAPLTTSFDNTLLKTTTRYSVLRRRGCAHGCPTARRSLSTYGTHSDMLRG